MRHLWLTIAFLAGPLGFGGEPNAPTPPDPAAVERGRAALLAHSYLKAEWRIDAYQNAWKLWGTASAPAPDPIADPDGYARAFASYYGLHPAPYDNEGLPMGLRWSRKTDGSRTGIQVDCMACHGGSIGGKSYVGLPNSTVDYELLLFDLFRADGRRPPLVPFTINTTRGTVNAGMMSVVLLSVRNPDLSRRALPLLLGANLPELDAPAWWTLRQKATMYQDGRTPAASVRSIMQFLLADKSRSEFEALEPTFADIHAYIRSIEPPAYPLPIDAPRAARGQVVFEHSCARCHGTYGADRSYPSKIVPIDVVGTDPARLMGISDRAVEHYNATWFAENHRVDPARVGYQAPPLDGIWATAPYLHNGSVPTLHALLLSSERPAHFTRPPSTELDHYDARNVGWKYQVVAPPAPAAPRKPTREAHFLYDTRRHGLGNQGHTFGDKLTEDQRMELIEYLKTL